MNKMNLGEPKMIMFATVIQSDPDSLLVRDLSTGGEVQVNTPDANQFAPGDQVRITFSGAMTLSIPPQISATNIQRIPGSTPEPHPTSEIRATILQRRHNSLLVWDANNNREVIVNYPYAYHFCAGQRIVVNYDTIRLSNPPEVNATDIIPICQMRQ